MVTRVESKAFTEFTGTVKSVASESNQIGDTPATEQYHIQIDAEDVEIKGKTGLIHEWIRMPPTAKPNSIPQGSVVDRYLQQVELVVPEAKDAETVEAAFALLQGKKFLFKRMKLGKAYEGHEAREYFVPVTLK